MILPNVALSIRQPWAHRILHEGKDVENRQWSTRFRGPVLIHAGKGVDADDREDLTAAMARGGIVGMVEIVDCVTDLDSRWFFGRFGFVLCNPRALEFLRCRGALGFFRPDIDFTALRPLGSVSAPAPEDSEK